MQTSEGTTTHYSRPVNTHFRPFKRKQQEKTSHNAQPRQGERGADPSRKARRRTWRLLRQPRPEQRPLPASGEKDKRARKDAASACTHVRKHAGGDVVLCAPVSFSVSQATAYPNSKWPPGSWKLPAPNDPFLLPRRTQRGCLPLVTTTPTPTPGRRPRDSTLAVIAREDQDGRDGK